MRCDDALVAVSLQADGELTDGPETAGLEAHLAGCATCRRFRRDVQRMRAHLRVEAVDHAPDLGPAVVARLTATGATPAPATAPTGHTDHPAPAALVATRSVRDPRTAGSRRRPVVAAAVALVAGLVGGATFVGIGTQPRSPAAAALPDLVMAAQHDVSSLDARLHITEVGVNGSSRGAGRSRTFDAHLAYRAPESLALSVHETTPGLAGADRASGDLVVDGDRWWQHLSRRCSPAAGLVHCPGEPVTFTRSVSGREPFSPEAPIPLDLITPVDSFALAGEPADLGAATIAGRPALGVAVTAAQVAPLLDGLSAGVDLRPVHPTDPVELWLDAEHLVPLALVVRAADDPLRHRWATSVGAGESPGDIVLTVTATAVRLDKPVDDALFAAPAGMTPSSTVDAGFRGSPPDDAHVASVPSPDHLPGDLRPHRSGTVSTAGGTAVALRSWSDGRAWLTVRATTEWRGGRLFGDLGPDVRPVDLGDAGTAYASGDGSRVALHTADRDVVVSGSLPADQIEAVAADLGVIGVPVPAGWDEAATATVEDASRALPNLLVAPELDGFGPPAVRVDAGTVTQAHAGAGGRGFALTQRASAVLSPPSSGDEAGVDVRGRAGRYSQQRGELEWIEDGLAVSLRSDSLGLDELLAIAGRLTPS